MEHSSNGESDGSSTKDDATLPASSLITTASVNHQSVTQSQEAIPHPAPAYKFQDSFNSSGFFLYLGCDSPEMEEEEELRNARENPEEEGFPSPIPQLRFSSKFALTPTVARKENEESGHMCNLTTPNQAPSTSVDCPERPSKLHRTSTSQCESSLSCRLLFSAAIPATPVPHIEEENSSDHNYTHLQATVSTKQCTPSHCQEGAAAPSSPPGKQSPLLMGDMEDPATTIRIPSSSSSSSSCSDCVECSSSSSASPVIASPYPLASPIMSQIKLTKQIMSSPEGNRVQDPVMDEVLDPPFSASDPQETSDKPEERVVENSGSHDTPQDPPEDALKEGQATKDPPLSTVKEMDVEEEVCSAARKVNSDPLEASLAPSSTGSVHSNWTVISGISPLPSSDPTHLHHHHCRRHHHHHSHHHGHHHHHHRKHRDEGQRTGNMFTSTPIHQKRVVKTVDVSAVASSQDAISDPRFVLTSELMFPDSQSDRREEASEEERQGGSGITGSPGSDKENRDPGCAPIRVPGVPHHAVCLTPMEEESTKLKRPRPGTGEEHGFEPESKTETETNAVEGILKTRRERATKDLVSIAERKKTLRRQLQPYRSCPQARPLTKAEAKALLAAPVNFSEHYFDPEHPSSPHLSSTVDESFFRDVPQEPLLSASLD